MLTWKWTLYRKEYRSLSSFLYVKNKGENIQTNDVIDIIKSHFKSLESQYELGRSNKESASQLMVKTILKEKR